MTRRTLILIAAVGLAGTAFFVSRGQAGFDTGAPDDAVIQLGQQIYADHCASCHGVDLEGQPDWQIPLDNGRFRAPPHDETGHTWHHADALLKQIIRDGTAAVVGNGYESDMPGFGNILSDDEITAVLAYIKSTWPERERAIQRRISTDRAP